MQPTLTSPEACQKLEVIIDRRKYELEDSTLEANLEAGVTLLALGDYKAKLVRDLHKTTYESSQAYEFLFPDKKPGNS
jgi:hypothetical protein